MNNNALAVGFRGSFHKANDDQDEQIVFSSQKQFRN